MTSVYNSFKFQEKAPVTVTGVMSFGCVVFLMVAKGLKKLNRNDYFNIQDLT